MKDFIFELGIWFIILFVDFLYAVFIYILTMWLTNGDYTKALFWIGLIILVELKNISADIKRK